MEIGPREIKEDDVVWINNHSEYSTYDQYRIRVNERTGATAVLLERGKLLTEVYNPNMTFVSIVHRFNPSIRLINEELANRQAVEQTEGFDIQPAPVDANDRTIALPQGEKPLLSKSFKANLVEGSNSLTIIKNRLLRRNGSIGLAIRVGGIDFDYRISELNCLLVDMARGDLTICSKDRLNQPHLTKYQLPEVQILTLASKLSNNK